jgi:hypothetical protein
MGMGMGMGMGRMALLVGLVLLLCAFPQQAAGGGKKPKGSRRCRKGKGCTACNQIVGCGWCAAGPGDGEGRCMDKASNPVGFWDPDAEKVSEECDGTLADTCLEIDPTRDTDRMSQKIERTVGSVQPVPYSQFSDGPFTALDHCRFRTASSLTPVRRTAGGSPKRWTCAATWRRSWTGSRARAL